MANIGITRRKALISGSVGVLGVVSPAIVRAQSREVTIGGPSGPQETAMRKSVIPGFEKAQNCKVRYDANLSLPNLAKLRANRSNPPFDVVLMDEAIILLAGQEDLLTPVKQANIPNMAKLAPSAIMRDGLWVTIMNPAVSIAYNTRLVKDGVSSWLDLWNPNFRERVLIPHPKTTQAPCLIAMAAHFETGKPLNDAQYDLDAGFKRLKQIKPNLLQAFIASAEAMPLLEQGEAWVAAGFFTGNTLPRKAAGAPVELARPKEGSFAFPRGAGKVKNSPSPELADAWIDWCLTPDIQTVFQRDFYGAPTNTTVPVDPSLVATKDLLQVDWGWYSARLNEISDRFDREIVQ
jgi:putative spermidine/putrescine transport system substrate-binding protein